MRALIDMRAVDMRAGDYRGCKMLRLRRFGPAKLPAPVKAFGKLSEGM